MPCCIAIIQYLRCRHNILFKIGCTAHCDDLCPVSEQRALLITRSLWSCEECHLRFWSAESETRSSTWNTRTEALSISNAPTSDDNREELLANLQSREQHEDRLIEHSRMAQLEEIQWVAEWTCQYGMSIWEVLYRQDEDPIRANQRIEELRGMRLWDFVVTRDALRSRKELLHQQQQRSRWIGQGYRGPRRKATPSPDSPDLVSQQLPPVPGHGRRLSQPEAETNDETEDVMMDQSPHSSHSDFDPGWDEQPNVPVSMDFLKKLADQKEYPASYLASQLWAPTVKNIPSAEYTYFMWDTLAVAFLGCEQLCTFKEVEIDVEVSGPSEGRTVSKPGSGKKISIADTVNVDGFFKYYLRQLQKDLHIELE